jgi:DNA-binding CsgD family transcriptional regulator
MRSGTLTAYLDQLFGRSSDVVFVVDAASRIVWWGARAEQVLAIPAERAIGRPCYEVLSPQHSVGGGCGPGCCVLAAARHGKTVPAFCLDMPGPVGKMRHFTVGFLTDPRGELVVHIVRERDVELGGTLEAKGRASVLTDREREVLRLMMAGATSREIADQLCISHATARNHTQNVLAKLDVHSRAEAAVAAIRASQRREADDES